MTCDYKHPSKYSSEALVIYMETTGFSLACISSFEHVPIYSFPITLPYPFCYPVI